MEGRKGTHTTKDSVLENILGCRGGGVRERKKKEIIPKEDFKIGFFCQIVSLIVGEGRIEVSGSVQAKNTFRYPTSQPILVPLEMSGGTTSDGTTSDGLEIWVAYCVALRVHFFFTILTPALALGRPITKCTLEDVGWVVIKLYMVQFPGADSQG